MSQQRVTWQNTETRLNQVAAGHAGEDRGGSPNRCHPSLPGAVQAPGDRDTAREESWWVISGRAKGWLWSVIRVYFRYIGWRKFFPFVLRILFIFRDKQGGRKRRRETLMQERETLLGCLSHAPPGDQTCNPGVCLDREPNQQLFALWDDPPAN